MAAGKRWKHYIRWHCPESLRGFGIHLIVVNRMPSGTLMLGLIKAQRSQPYCIYSFQPDSIPFWMSKLKGLLENWRYAVPAGFSFLARKVPCDG